MNTLALFCRAFYIGLMTAILSGCNTTQPVGPSSALGQSTPMQGLSNHSTQSDNLVYVVGPNKTYVISYTDGTLLQTLPKIALGICSDSAGNVFLPTEDHIYEYAHGNASAVAKLNDPGYDPEGCAVDPSSGDLAVANFKAKAGSNRRGNVAIYAGATGLPRFIRAPKIEFYLSCTYDNDGNLIVAGYTNSNEFVFGKLPAGSSDFKIYTLAKPLYDVGMIQWDGQYVALAARRAKVIDRISLTGSEAVVVGSTTLYMPRHVANPTFWIQGQSILTVTGASKHKVGIWPYPRGGKVETELGPVIQGKGTLQALTVSVGP